MGARYEERHLIEIHGLEKVSLIVRHIEAFQQLDVFFAEALASMMMFLVLGGFLGDAYRGLKAVEALACSVFAIRAMLNVQTADNSFRVGTRGWGSVLFISDFNLLGSLIYC